MQLFGQQGWGGDLNTQIFSDMAEIVSLVSKVLKTKNLTSEISATVELSSPILTENNLESLYHDIPQIGI